ncbi:MAG: ABC transporter ATP-binding protein [Ignavibacteriae bacterium]|nr:ABC transporter ATP-binding protein [Ignavibacteriota bacterium]
MFDLFDDNDDDAHEEQTPKKLKFSLIPKIAQLFQGHHGKIIVALGFAFASTLFLVGLPLVFRKIIDDGITHKNVSLTLYLALGYLVMTVLYRTFEYLQTVLVGSMGISIVNSLKMKLLKHTLTLSIRFFDKTETGKLISRIESDSQRMFMLFSSVGLQLFSSSLIILFSFAVMFTVNVEFTLYVLCCAPLFLGSAIIVFSRMRPLFRKEREMYSQITGFAGEHISAIPLLRNLNSIQWSRNKFLEMNREKTKFSLKVEAIEASFWGVMFLTPMIATTIIFYLGSNQISSGVMTIGTLLLFFQYITGIMSPLITISEQISEVQKAFASSERIFDLLATQPEVKNPVIPATVPEFSDCIKFENVTFGYNDSPILKNVSFDIKKGTSVAIVGATGAGKTTITSLLTRWYDVQSGKITLDGINIKDFRQQDLAEIMSFVMQDIYLFPGTIRDNLRAMRIDIPDSQVEEAIHSLDIEHIIARFENGLDTILSENGKNLSFGERQLLSFARALTFQPEILIIDEATSSVDPATEARLQDSLLTLLQGRTSIIIAHRLSTIVHADKIVVMDQGQLAEEGTHDELLLQNGIYARLYHLQSGQNNYA